MDTYRNFAELSRTEREGEDFRVKVVAREGASVVVIAPHGGAIEPGTSEIAEMIAGDDLSLAVFAGIKPRGNELLHITSTNFDEPKCVALVGASYKVLAIHGEESTEPIVFLGGKDIVAGAQIRKALERAGYSVRSHADPKLQGIADHNICNRSLRGAGVQLELSRGLRATFFEGLNAAGRKRPTPQLQRFAQAVREGLLEKTTGGRNSARACRPPPSSPLSREQPAGDSASLPNDIAALWFACRCFDVREKDLSEASRTRVKRARDEKGISPSQRDRVSRELFDRLLERFRTHGIAPVSVTNGFTDELTVSLLNLYERVRQRIEMRGLSTNAVGWTIIEQVFVPTLYLLVARYQHLGLGTEFRIDQCWYLPIETGSRTMTPVQRVLDHWLRVAGLLTAYGLARRPRTGPRTAGAETPPTDGWHNEKRRIQRWLNGEVLPNLIELHHLVDKRADGVSWLADAASWKARFTLAVAMQHACNSLDKAFAGLGARPSMRLTESFRKLADERLLVDDDDLLSNSTTFFASRLIQADLRNRGTLGEIVSRATVRRGARFGPERSDDEIARYREKITRESNPGSWLSAFLWHDAENAGRVKRADRSVESRLRMQEYLFDRGIELLNRRLVTDSQKTGGKRSRRSGFK